jgi:hypothetical protein
VHGFGGKIGFSRFFDRRLTRFLDIQTTLDGERVRDASAQCVVLFLWCSFFFVPFTLLLLWIHSPPVSAAMFEFVGFFLFHSEECTFTPKRQLSIGKG